jgi:hypothetical protein
VKRCLDEDLFEEMLALMQPTVLLERMDAEMRDAIRRTAEPLPQAGPAQRAAKIAVTRLSHRDLLDAPAPACPTLLYWTLVGRV